MNKGPLYRLLVLVNALTEFASTPEWSQTLHGKDYYKLEKDFYREYYWKKDERI